MIFVHFLRIIGEFWLCWLVFQEAGFYTALSVFLIFMSLEMSTFYLRRLNKLLTIYHKKFGVSKQ